MRPTTRNMKETTPRLITTNCSKHDEPHRGPEEKVTLYKKGTEAFLETAQPRTQWRTSMNYWKRKLPIQNSTPREIFFQESMSKTDVLGPICPPAAAMWDREGELLRQREMVPGGNTGLTENQGQGSLTGTQAHTLLMSRRRAAVFTQQRQSRVGETGCAWQNPEYLLFGSLWIF